MAESNNFLEFLFCVEFHDFYTPTLGVSNLGRIKFGKYHRGGEDGESSNLPGYGLIREK